MKLLLVCAGGMSTSMLMKKLEAYAAKEGREFEVAAIGVEELVNPADKGYDVILLGPQIAYRKDKIVKKCQGLPIDVIPMKDYGMGNCANIFAQMDALLG